MLLCNDIQNFKIIIENASREMNIASNYIEKDFYAISILKELISRDNKFVFKGGTSLSVCQKAINRFSEDIDVSYEDEIITVGKRRRIKQAFFDSIESVSLNVSNPDNIRSRRMFNRYLCPYESVVGNNNDKVIVEWATITPSFPIEEKTAQTIIGKYLESINRFDLVEKYGLESFTVKTLTKERTMVDKIFAICDYHLSKLLDRESRHIYDIHQLLKTVELNESFVELFNKVKEYRLPLERCHSVRCGRKISELLKELIKEGTFKSDYNRITYPLLYDRVKYEDCLPSIQRIAVYLEENGL